MAKLKPAKLDSRSAWSHLDNKLSSELGPDGRVISTGELEVKKYSPSQHEATIHYLRLKHPVGNHEQGLAFIVDPYDLLIFAHQIIKEFDPKNILDQ